MLGPHYAEGKALRMSQGDSLQLELPDDDADATGLMLGLIYFRLDKTTPDLRKLLNLAAVVDKYSCQAACETQTTTWMKNILLDTGLTSDLPEYLGMAIQVESQQVFNAVCVGLALTSDPNQRHDNTVQRRISGSNSSDWVSPGLVSEYLIRWCALSFFHRDSLTRV